MGAGSAGVAGACALAASAQAAEAATKARIPLSGAGVYRVAGSSRRDGRRVFRAQAPQQLVERGDALFSGKAQCNNCHVEPLWTEPGWNLHTPDEIGIDSFEADRAPDHMYKTMNLAGIFVRENGKFMKTGNKGRYFHDGRFATLLDVVNHYNTHFSLGLTGQEKTDLVEYLKSLPSEK